jgi:hypothetical protein
VILALPIITAVELTFNPMDATTIAQAKIHKLEPLKEILILQNIFFFFLLHLG